MERSTGSVDMITLRSSGNGYWREVTTRMEDKVIIWLQRSFDRGVIARVFTRYGNELEEFRAWGWSDLDEAIEEQTLELENNGYKVVRVEVATS
jgi:hypothetical protein